MIFSLSFPKMKTLLLSGKDIFSFSFFFFFGCSHSMNVPDQGSNPHHSSDSSHFSDNAGNLNHSATRELLFKGCYIKEIMFYSYLKYSEYKIHI